MPEKETDRHFGSQPPEGGWATRPRADEFEKAMESGNRLKQLIALRGMLTFKLQLAGGRDAAPLAKELREVLEAIDLIDHGKEENSLDISRRDVQRLWDGIVAAEQSDGRANSSDPDPAAGPV